MSADTYSDSALEDSVKHFMKGFKDEKREYSYINAIDELPALNKTHITVNVSTFEGTNLEKVFQDEPRKLLNAFGEAIESITMTRYPSYAKANSGKFTARLTNIPIITKLRDVDDDYVGKYISTHGILMEMSVPEMLVLEGHYVCEDGHVTIVNADRNLVIKVPLMCQVPDCKHKEPKLIPEKSRFVNYQIMRIQEMQDETVAGTIPITAEILVTGDLVNESRMGDKVLVAGIIHVELGRKLKLGAETQSYRLRMYGNNVVTEHDDANVIDAITDEDRAEIRDMITKVDPATAISLVVKSFARKIYGNDMVKEALLLTIIGGKTVIKSDGSKIRGDINIFLVGDPGIAKSELGKAVEIVAPRAFYTSGRGSTGAGLTAATIQDRTTGAFMIKPGATVLADGGICVIDEFDKTRPEDRSSLHEVMEQQCYSADTEILTEDGWKQFRDAENVRVATLVDGKMRFAMPERHYSYMHVGRMIRFESDQVDMLVTPNHKMYVNTGMESTHYRDYGRVEADSIRDCPAQFMKTCRWDGNDEEMFGDACEETKFNEEDVKTWMNFIGFYMAAGGLEKKDDTPVTVAFDTSMMSPEAQSFLISCVRRLGYEPDVTDGEMSVESVDLASKVAVYGYGGTECLPKTILMLSAKYLRTMVGAMLEGQGRGRFHTISEVLSHQFQEACAKIGMAANDTVVAMAGARSDVSGFETDRLPRDLHGLDMVDGRNCHPTLTAQDITEEGYSGMVYCVEVPGNVVYVRRNGKPAWCGNSVSIAKGGHMMRLNARTSVVAIANPLNGRYDGDKPLLENIPSIPPTLLSRFDLIFVMRDTPNAELDDNIMSHFRTAFSAGTDRISSGMDDKTFRKYLRIAKDIQPTIADGAWDILQKYFREMRARASDDVAPITMRQFEGLVRLTVANAKMLLTDVAGVGEAERAVNMMKYSLESSSLDLETGEVDMGVVRGVPTREAGQRGLFRTIFQGLADMSEDSIVKKSDMLSEMMKSGKWEYDAAVTFLEKMHTAGMLYEKSPGRYGLV